MLRLVEYGLLAVSLLIVLVLIVAAPSSERPFPAENSDGELEPKLPPVASR
ncbi:hypothetical protein HNQ77_004938 [Silvibacterium bohemicum]|uniref:Uncharacterized protein n=1 Tax=Silvibacterium bohemicum TaxID=1577686 RepID=A0A841K309_9BACT|nr:hypothetical protein [Silvibacterium bohemicum]MBB6146957.1 hypothetical protein [Silvibacterium bohemicum]